MSQPSDLELIRQLQAGDEEALLALHERYVNLVYSVAYRVLEEQMAAEEVTQDTFMRLWHKAHTYNPEKGRFTVWLLTVARRLAIDVLRQRQRRQPKQGLFFMDENPQLWDEVLAADKSDDLKQTLLSIMEQLPPEQRDAIELAYFYGMTHSDIAAYLNIPLGTVKGRIRQGMQKLRLAWMTELSINPQLDK
ncbi:MAG: sigma-70 family RNA polymerase sigma factor [Chloroflexi bacterium]|nr:MAG: RNA polymerase subunit sigma-24 [Phototrophicales bacterium]RMF82857.1 MAG: sigma-70 family RNA polymerase sigma factor [Chloroflexota bacterium]